MLITFESKAKKTLDVLPLKHRRQIENRIFELRDSPIPCGSKKLLGKEGYRRIKAGEYRIIYRYEEINSLIVVVLIGKRNGDDVYRIARRVL